MYRAAGEDHYRPISWDGAFDVVADALAASGDPDRAVFYTSGRTSNEAAFLYQLLVRRLGTNNLPDCSNMCHESSGVALTQTIGIGKGSVTLDDVHEADLILVVGQNPGTNHPRMLSALELAKRRGAAIVAVNPLPEAGLIRFKNPQHARGIVGKGTALADEFLQVKLGADLALFQLAEPPAGGARCRAGRRRARPAVPRRALRRRRRAARPPADHRPGAAARARPGSTPRAVERVAQLLADREPDHHLLGDGHHPAPPGRAHHPGDGQHAPAAGEHRQGRAPACARCAATPTCRATGRWASTRSRPTRSSTRSAPSSASSRRASTATTRSTPSAPWPRGDVDVFVGMGGNFLVGRRPTPTPPPRRSAGRQLTVQVSTKLNRSHVVGGEAALILPCLGRTEIDRTGGREQRVTVEDSMSMVHASTGRLEPASPELRSEVAIVCGLAERILGADDDIGWAELAADYDRIRDRIEAVIPGFTDFNRRIDHPGGFVLPHPPRDQRTFPTATGKARLTVQHVRRRRRCPPGGSLLQTLRSHDQFNTTIYGLDDRYRGIKDGRRVVFVHPDDLAALPGGFADGDVVDVVSEAADGVERRAAALPPGGLRRGPRHLRGVLPRGQRAGAARLRGRGEQHPDLQGGHRPLRAPLSQAGVRVSWGRRARRRRSRGGRTRSR